MTHFLVRFSSETINPSRLISSISIEELILRYLGIKIILKTLTLGCFLAKFSLKTPTAPGLFGVARSVSRSWSGLHPVVCCLLHNVQCSFSNCSSSFFKLFTFFTHAIASLCLLLLYVLQKGGDPSSNTITFILLSLWLSC